MKTEEINLNEGQETAVSRIQDFLSKKISVKDDCYFILSGAAGTGKTTVLRALIPVLKKKGNICISAPTHAAKDVASEVTGLEGKTIQSLLGLRPNADLENYDPAKKSFTQKEEPQISFYRVIVIDEASMIGPEALSKIIDEAFYHKVYIIFVGDKYQLPPIIKNDKKFVSPVFNLIGDNYELKEVMRQEEGNPLLELLKALRFDLDNKNSTTFVDYMSSTRIAGDSGVYFCKDSREFVQKAYEHINIENPLSGKMLFYTNEEAANYAYHFRKAVFGEAPQMFNVGESLTAFRTIFKEDSPDKQDLPPLVNGYSYLIKKIDEFTHPEYNFKYFGLTIEDRKENSMYINVVAPPFDNFILQHDLLLNKALSEAGRAWMDFYLFVDRFLTQRPIVQRKTDKFGQELSKVAVIKTIDYSYSSTIHKAQGQTLDYAFVNVRDIYKVQDRVLRLKLLYTAFSRAKKIAFVLR